MTSACNQITTWSWSLDAELHVEGGAESLLSPDEIGRSRAFASLDLRRRFVAARAGLRLALGRHLGCDPRILSFVQDTFGKPRLAGSRTVHFSLSHSGGEAVVAISDTLEVGADIEHMRPVEHIDLARRYFHPNERDAIERPAHSEDQRQVFFRTWTLKEAVVKSLGVGLSVELDSFEVSADPALPRLVRAPEGAPQDWWLDVTTVAGNYCRALAAPGVGDVGLIQRTL